MLDFGLVDVFLRSAWLQSRWRLCLVSVSLAFLFGFGLIGVFPDFGLVDVSVWLRSSWRLAWLRPRWRSCLAFLFGFIPVAVFGLGLVDVFAWLRSSLRFWLRDSVAIFHCDD